MSGVTSGVRRGTVEAKLLLNTPQASTQTPRITGPRRSFLVLLPSSDRDGKRDASISSASAVRYSSLQPLLNASPPVSASFNDARSLVRWCGPSVNALRAYSCLPNAIASASTLRRWQNSRVVILLYACDHPASNNFQNLILLASGQSGCVGCGDVLVVVCTAGAVTATPAPPIPFAAVCVKVN